MTRPRPAALALAAALLAGATVLPARAENPPLKDGLPCFSDACVGDDVRDLRDLEWVPAPNPVGDQPLSQAQVTPGYLETLTSLLRASPAAIAAVAPFWATRRFDAAGLQALLRIRAVCNPLGYSERLRATYLDRDGGRVNVAVEPVASDDGKEQRFVVASLSRVFDADSGGVIALGREIAARFAGVPAYPDEKRPGVRWLPAAPSGPSLKLFAPLGDSRERAAALRRLPGCR